MIPENLKSQSMECARGIAEHFCNNQSKHGDNNPCAGSVPWMMYENGQIDLGYNWNHAFSIMGLLSAYHTFGECRYETAALRMGRWLKTLQIFDPFRPQNYGAIRETTPQTPWCYPRDAVSAAWGFIELYRHTGDEEYLERARLFGEWFFAHAMDEEGWPLWGVQLEPFFDHAHPQICNHCQGSFHGGSLAFLYHLAQATGDEKWTGEPFVRMADILVNDIQQDSGYFVTIDRKTKQPPSEDPQKGLHRANDDLCTLGLLGAYRITGDKRYLQGIEKFLTAVCASQQDDGMLDHTVASLPIVLNILYETQGLLAIPTLTDTFVPKAMARIFSAQSNGDPVASMRGGLIEEPSWRDDVVIARSAAYSLIVLVKIFDATLKYLSIEEK